MSGSICGKRNVLKATMNTGKFGKRDCKTPDVLFGPDCEFI